MNFGLIALFGLYIFAQATSESQLQTQQQNVINDKLSAMIAEFTEYADDQLTGTDIRFNATAGSARNGLSGIETSTTGELHSMLDDVSLKLSSSIADGGYPESCAKKIAPELADLAEVGEFALLLCGECFKNKVTSFERDVSTKISELRSYIPHAYNFVEECKAVIDKEDECVNKKIAEAKIWLSSITSKIDRFIEVSNKKSSYALKGILSCSDAVITSVETECQQIKYKIGHCYDL